ncbi:MAG: response regulator [Desulfobacterales bacterium]|nr:response regulator [Desulfobacterales bacterium]
MESKGRLLIVDDEPDILEFLKWQLEMKNYQVDTCLSGNQALEILQKKIFDILLADIRMPGINGIELIQRTLKIQPDIQCIVITGHGGIETAIEAMRIGAINYLRKPIGIDELEMAVEKGIEKLKLVLEVKEKQRQLEIANNELLKLKEQLEIALKNEKQDRIEAESALKKSQLKELAVDVMALSLRLWKQALKKSKIDLAEESKIWTATLDSSGTYRTRTLDRYLRINTLPPNPRFNDVLDTAYFVLSSSKTNEELKDKLSSRVILLEKMLQ